MLGGGVIHETKSRASGKKETTMNQQFTEHLILYFTAVPMGSRAM